jgi:Tim10/DDP family zinc finger
MDQRVQCLVQPQTAPFRQLYRHSVVVVTVRDGQLVRNPAIMSDLGAQLSQLTPEQRQAIMMKAQQEANEQVMQEMMKRMTSACFEKCAGTSVRKSLLLLSMRDSS